MLCFLEKQNKVNPNARTQDLMRNAPCEQCANEIIECMSYGIATRLRSSQQDRVSQQQKASHVRGKQRTGCCRQS